MLEVYFIVFGSNVRSSYCLNMASTAYEIKCNF